MRKFAWLFPLLFITACSTTTEVRRLNPVPIASKAPTECRLVSVLADSPASKAGLKVGDHVLKINDKIPVDAWEAGELVNASGDVLKAEVSADSGPVRSIPVPLNKTRPRLGAACDLTGFRRHSVTAAGNESQTIFDGPYAMTASGIVDKALIFIRVRLANNAAKDLPSSADLFAVKDASGNALPILTPKDVICDLFGDRGAHMLSLKVKRREGVDFQTAASPPDETCGTMPMKGRLKTTDPSYVESNAEYLARESLWPVTLKPGQTAHGVEAKDFNSYGARRGHDEVMVRGTFGNIRLKNQLAPGTEGGWTRHLPDGETMSIFDASVKYRQKQTPLIVLAGKEYGSGSSRDWAAKGPALLGIQAVIAESYERIHRSNLVGMGILPLQYKEGENRSTLGLTGEETYSFSGITEDLTPKKAVTVTATDASGKTKTFQATLRIDTPVEIEYYRHGGILPYVLRQLLA